MRRKKAIVPDGAGLNEKYGFAEDLSGCYRELAARGRDKHDQQAAIRLLFNHATVKAIALKFLFPKGWKLADLLAMKRRYDRETRSLGQAREEADDFLAWVIYSGRYHVLCDTALRTKRWEDFPLVLSGGDGLRNLMFDYLKQKVRGTVLVRPEQKDDSQGRPAENEPAEPETDLSPSWLTADHIQEIRTRVQRVVSEDQDRQRAFTLYLLSLPYVGDVHSTDSAALTAKFDWLQPETESLYGAMRARWLERVQKCRRRRDEHLNRRQRLLTMIYQSERTGKHAAKRERWERLAEQYLHNAGACDVELQGLYWRLVDETDIQRLLNLESPAAGRAVRKRAMRLLFQIIQEVTGRTPPTPSQRRRMAAEEKAQDPV